MPTEGKGLFLIVSHDFFPSLSVFADKTLEKPKSGTLKSPPKAFDTSVISKTYYNVVSIVLFRKLCLCVCFYILLFIVDTLMENNNSHSYMF